MSRLRSFSMPRFYSATSQDDMMAGSAAALTQGASGHSRDSSEASSASAPSTPTFSTSSRSHSRWPSSTSSLVSVPDAPANVNKSALHDLVEDPSEREDSFDHAPSVDEPLCICDDARCEHRRTVIMPSNWQLPSPTNAEWSPGDDTASASDFNSERSFKRRRSGDFSSTESFSARFSRRLPSISKRWKDTKPTTSVTKTTVRSAPPSRSSSLRLPSFRRSVTSQVEPAISVTSTPPYSPVDSQPDDNVLTRARALTRPQKPVDIKILDPADEPIDRQGLSSTPLLPPLVDKHRSRSHDALSPLQSPSVAGASATGSVVGTPTHGPYPYISGIPTPPLSSKPSVASFQPGHLTWHSTSDIPAMNIAHDDDPWAVKLGHANFHIEPEPYLPETATLQASKRLLNDWAHARTQYNRQAEHVKENHGPTSQIYKDTEAKWAEIDTRWREYHDRVKAEAEANGEVEEIQRTLARDTNSTSKLPLPTLSDPDQPSKFPQIDDSDIVGPMVQYEVQRKRTASSAKIRPTILKLFTDPASLLGIVRK